MLPTVYIMEVPLCANPEQQMAYNATAVTERIKVLTFERVKQSELHDLEI